MAEQDNFCTFLSFFGMSELGRKGVLFCKKLHKSWKTSKFYDIIRFNRVLYDVVAK